MGAPTAQRRDTSADAPLREPVRQPATSDHPGRARAERRLARRRTPAAAQPASCWRCGRPPLPDRPSCARCAAVLDRRAAELRRTREAA
jgi:hypothetical protein